MAAPILHTKLHIPGLRPESIARPRLLSRLNEGVGRRLILVTAPAGFGKSTLIAEWLAEKRSDPLKPVIGWVSLDEGDNDIGRFLAYLLAALGDSDLTAGLHEMLDAGLPAETILTALINNLVPPNRSMILVWDDYHRINASDVHAAVAFLLENLPPNLKVVLISRTDPPLPLARLRAGRQMTEIRARDLRFTLDEVDVFLASALDEALTQDEVRTLEARTEGWIAGLQMAALSLRGHAAPGKFIEAFAGSHRYIFDYLTDEVLSQRPTGTRDFLLQTSILDRMCAPLCEAVTGRSDGQAVLETLEAANLFIVPLDDDREWYRYHHLFADLLRARLARQFPDRWIAAHLAASLWLEDQGQLYEAIDHALAANDHGRAAGMIEQLAHGMSHRYETFHLDRWIKSLPEEMLLQRPRILYPYAVTLSLTNRFAEWGEYLDKAERAARANPSHPESDSILGQVLVMKAIRPFLFGDFAEALARSVEAARVLPDLGMSGDRWDLESILAYSTIQWLGDLESGMPQLLESLRMAEADGGSLGATLCYSFASNVHILRGSLAESRSFAQRALAASTAPDGSYLQGAAYPRALIGRLNYGRNLLDEAEAHLADAVRPLSAITGLTTDPLDSVYAYTMLLQTIGDPAGAEAFLDEADKHFAAIPISEAFREHLKAVRVRLFLRQRQGAPAVQDQDFRSPPVFTKDYHPVHAFSDLTRARVGLSLGDFTAISTFLESFQKWARQRGFLGLAVEAEMLLAIAWARLGREEAAVTHIERALIPAAAQGWTRIFLDEGEPVRAVLKRVHPQEDGLRAFVRQLLAHFDAEKRSQVGFETVLDRDSKPAIIEPLTDRELEVLNLVAEGDSNAEIARKLFITVGTVKRHTANIYAKLGVGNRTHAVARAREYGMIP